MEKLNYGFIAKQPIHTGSDENLGILRTLKRFKVVSDIKKVSITRFKPEQKLIKRQAVALILLRLWSNITDKARTTIYDEISSKLLASASARTKEEFIEQFSRRLGIRDISSEYDRRFDVIDILELFDDEELLELIRKESQYIMSMFRKMKDDTLAWVKETKAGKSAANKNTLFGEVTTTLSPEVLIQNNLEEILKQPFVKSEPKTFIDYVPGISGNSLRGYLRRLVMDDFTKQVGIKKISPDFYHLLFTGGTISSSTGHEDLDLRTNYLTLCPMLGLFGSAIGSQTIQGTLSVGQSTLKCVENGNGSLSYHDQISIIFGTRLDSSKLEHHDIEIVGKDDQTHQMKYEYETFIQGAEFEHSFIANTENPLLLSAFARMIKLFKENPYLCAKSSIGHGEVDLKELNTSYTDELYLKHLQDNQDKIKSFFNA